MALETASYISQLVLTNPVGGSDAKSQGDDHIRLLKTVLQTQFPNFTAAACTPTVTELNYVAGVTSAIQTQLNAKAPAASPTFTGTITAAAITATGALSLTGSVAMASASSVTAPTVAAGSNGTSVATTEFVQTALAAATGGASRAEMYFYGSF